MVPKGVSWVCSGMGMLCGMGAIGCVRGDFVVEGMLVRIAYYVGVYFGSSVIIFMYACHEACMSVVFGVRSLGSLRCSVPAGRSRGDRRVSMAVRKYFFWLVLLPWGSLARMTSMGRMRYVKATWEVCLMVSRLFHL